ncbi:site-specific integrase [Rhizobium leguminosarum]|nr:site-specific integrase [Rhizobium leguminosarum]
MPGHDPQHSCLQANFEPVVHFVQLTGARTQQIAKLRLSDLILTEADESALDSCGFILIGGTEVNIALSREALDFLRRYITTERKRVLAKNNMSEDAGPDGVFLSPRGKQLCASTLSDVLRHSLKFLPREPDASRARDR